MKPLLLCILAVPVMAQTISVSGTDVSQPVVNQMATNSANISVAAFNTSGVALVPNGTPDFQLLLGALVPSEILTVIQPILPYSVFIKNESTKSIIAYTLSWATIDNDGEPFTDDRIVCDFISLKPLLSPHSAALATFFGPLNPAAATDPQLRTEISEQAGTFKSKASVTISVEAVMFEDGTTVGVDSSRSVSQIVARLQAERDLYVTTVEKTTSSSDAETTSWLQAVASAFPPGSHLNLQGDPYAAWYQFYRSRIASGLINLIGKRDFSVMISYVQAELGRKPYPATIINKAP
jgi:hypothetical protein